MFGIGTGELILIAAIAIIILGPKRCLETSRSLGKLFRSLRAEMAAAKDSFDLDDKDHDPTRRS